MIEKKLPPRSCSVVMAEPRRERKEVDGLGQSISRQVGLHMLHGLDV